MLRSWSGVGGDQKAPLQTESEGFAVSQGLLLLLLLKYVERRQRQTIDLSFILEI